MMESGVTQFFAQEASRFGMGLSNYWAGGDMEFEQSSVTQECSVLFLAHPRDPQKGALEIRYPLGSISGLPDLVDRALEFFARAEA